MHRPTTTTVAFVLILANLTFALGGALADEVEDTTPPVIEQPADVSAEATGPDGAIVLYDAPATSDDVDEPGVATCAPETNTTFALGATMVTCTAADAAGNEAVPVFFNVTVVDTTAPVIAAKALFNANVPNPAGGAVTYTPPVWTDAVDGSGPATCAPAPGDFFALGDTTVTCDATDAAGNVANQTQFIVRVKIAGVGVVGTEQATYTAEEALTDGVRGGYRLTSADGTPLPNVSVTVRVLRQMPFLGFTDSETFTGATDADGRFAFEASTAFELPTPYLIIATPSHPLLSGGLASARYTVTAT